MITPTFNHMPISIKEQIIWNLGFKDRITCRYVSHQLNAISNASAPMRITSMQVKATPGTIFIFLHGIIRCFLRSPTGCTMQRGFRVVRTDDDYMLEARRFLRRLLSCHVAIGRIDVGGCEETVRVLFAGLDELRVPVRGLGGQSFLRAEQLWKALRVIGGSAFQNRGLWSFTFCGGVHLDEFGVVYEGTRIDFGQLKNWNECMINVEFMDKHDVERVIEMFERDSTKTRIRITSKSIDFDWLLEPVDSPGQLISGVENFNWCVKMSRHFDSGTFLTVLELKR